MINKEKLLMSNNSSVLDFRWRDSVSIRLWICSLLTANWLQPRPLTAITAPLAYPPMLGGLKAGDGPVLILESSILTELPSRVLTQLRLYSLFTAAEQFVKKKKNFLRDWRSSYFLKFFLCFASLPPSQTLLDECRISLYLPRLNLSPGLFSVLWEQPLFPLHIITKIWHVLLTLGMYAPI